MKGVAAREIWGTFLKGTTVNSNSCRYDLNGNLTTGRAGMFLKINLHEEG